MAKLTGYMCDVCKTAENGNARPLHWRQRHEMNGGRDDCLVCEFLKGEVSA